MGFKDQLPLRVSILAVMSVYVSLSLIPQAHAQDSLDHDIPNAKTLDEFIAGAPPAQPPVANVANQVTPLALIRPSGTGIAVWRNLLLSEQSKASGESKSSLASALTATPPFSFYLQPSFGQSTGQLASGLGFGIAYAPAYSAIIKQSELRLRYRTAHKYDGDLDREVSDAQLKLKFLSGGKSDPMFFDSHRFFTDVTLVGRATQTRSVKKRYDATMAFDHQLGVLTPEVDLSYSKADNDQSADKDAVFADFVLAYSILRPSGADPSDPKKTQYATRATFVVDYTGTNGVDGSDSYAVSGIIPLGTGVTGVFGVGKGRSVSAQLTYKFN